MVKLSLSQINKFGIHFLFMRQIVGLDGFFTKLETLCHCRSDFYLKFYVQVEHARLTTLSKAACTRPKRCAVLIVRGKYVRYGTR